MNNHQIIKKDFKYYYNYLLVLIGLAIVSWIIWARFLRGRVPKDIPFTLTEKGFYILVYICIIYLYIVWSLLKPKEPHESITQLMSLIYTPLTRLDEYLKNNRYIYPIYDQVLQYILNKHIQQANFKHMKRLYIICYIIPRSILITIFCIDTFYCNKLEWIYKIILIGLIPLLHRYVKYSLRAVKEQYLSVLDTKYSKVWVLDKHYTNEDWELTPNHIHHNTKVSIKDYVEIQMNTKLAYIMKESETEYSGDPFVRQEYYDTNKNENTLLTEKEKYDLLCNDFNSMMPKLLDLSIFLKNYSYIEYSALLLHITFISIKHVKILIFSLYLLCWSYILLVSLPSLYNVALYEPLITFNIFYIEEPFSFTSIL